MLYIAYMYGQPIFAHVNFHDIKYLQQLYLLSPYIIETAYRKVPKVTVLVTFGFSSLFLLLLSEGRYSRGSLLSGT